MKNFKLVLFILGVMLLLPLGVNAEEYSITAESSGVSVSADLVMTLKGIEEYKEESHITYFVKFVNEGDAKPTDGTYDNLYINSKTYVDRNDITKWKESSKEGKIYIEGDWYMLNGYDYAYVAKCDYSSTVKTCTTTDSPIKVERPSLPAYGKRYTTFVFSGHTKNGVKTDVGSKISVFANFPNEGEAGSHKYVIKFGKITDSSIITKYANNTSDKESSLITYAKAASDKTYNFNDDTSSYDFEIDSFTADFNAYYYVYTTYENSDGTYRDLDDIYVGKFDEGGTLVQSTSYGDASTTSNIKNVSVTTEEENPNTMDKNILISVIAMMAVVGIFIMTYKKFKKVK